MNNYKQIVTDRLILRPIKIEDSNSIFRYRSNSLVNQYQGWIPKTIDDVHNFIKTKVSAEIDIPNTWYQLVIIIKENNILIGDIGIHFLHSDQYQVEIGCTLDQSYHGKGYATEALKETMNFLFCSLNKHRIIVSIDPRNKKSIELSERSGFRKEAHFKESLFINNEWVDDLVYSIQKDDFFGKPSNRKILFQNIKNNKL
jgi:RimJ/RimL family protein N-acetyltransferase